MADGRCAPGRAPRPLGSVQTPELRAMNRLVIPLRLRSTREAGRKVTWLELFFDLIFVAAVAQVAEPLRHAYTVAELVRFAPLFALIWLAWIGHTFFSTRFGTDDGVQRALTFLQIFA